MIKNETVITAVSKQYVKQLTSQKQRIVKINTIPGIASEALQVIRDYYTENVGYDDIPIACLGRLNNKSVNLRSADSAVVEAGVLPVRANDTMLLEIQLPYDMIVSVDLEAILCASREFSSAASDYDKQCIAERLSDQLVVGIPSEDEGGTADMLSFIPFLDLTQCSHFAVLDNSFNKQDLGVGSRWKAMPITEVAAFL